MASNADIFKKYGLTESGKKQAAVTPPAAPSSAAILAKYGLTSAPTSDIADRQEQSAQAAEAAHIAKALNSDRQEESVAHTEAAHAAATRAGVSQAVPGTGGGRGSGNGQQTLPQRLEHTISGAAKLYARQNVGIGEWMSDIEAEYQAAREAAGIPSGGYKEGNNGRVWGDEPTAASARQQAEDLKAIGNRLGQSGMADVERAKQGLGKAGQFAVDLGVGAAQMGADVGVGILTGGGAMLPMLARSFGGGVQQAREKGYDLKQQTALGLANAATEYFSEKLFGGNPAYDKDVGLVNKALNKAITKYVGPDEAAKLMRVLSSPVAETLNEGWEEVVSDFLNPKWEQLFTGAVDERTKEEKLRQYAESWASGVLLALIGQGGQAVSKNFTSAEKPKYLKTAKELYGFEPEGYEGTADAGKAATAETSEGSLTPQVIGAVEAQILPDRTQNTRLTEDDRQEYMATGDRKHVRDQKARIEEAGGSPVLTSIAEVKNFIRQALIGGLRDTVAGYGKVGSRLTNDILTATNGSNDIGGYYLELDANEIAHLKDHFGQDDDPRNIPLTEEQIQSIPDYIDTYDDLIDVIRRKDGSLRLMLGKKINGHSIIIEAVSKGRRALHPVTAWQIDSARYNRDYKTRAVGRSSASRSTNRTTVDTSRPATTLSDATIAQQSDSVKSGSEYDAMRLKTAEEMFGQQAPISGDASTEGYMDALVNSEPKPEKRNRPSRSKSHLRSDLISTFSIPEGSRATFANRIDAIADEMLTNGRISDEHRAELIRALYDAGVSVQEADPAYKAARDALKGRKIFVNESIRSELGDDWNDLRRRAMANGFYLTADSNNGLGVDVVADELSSVLGNSIINSDADGATQLRQMVDAAQLGRNETISLADEADLLAQQYGEGVREDQISNLERQFDDAMRRFAEKARLEVDLKDRTDERVAREKEVWREAFRKRDDAKKQREAAKQTLNNLKRLRKRIGQNDTRLAEAIGQLSPEEQKLAQEALGNLSTDAQRLTEKAKAKMAENAARYEQLVANDPNYIPDKKTLALLERMDQKYLADMSTEELMNLHRALQTLEKHLSDMNKEIGRKRGEEFAVLYRDAKYNVEGSKGRAPGGKLKSTMSRFIDEEQLTPMNYLEMLGGWDPENTWNKTVTRQLEEGERARKQFVVEANQMLKDWREKHADWIAKSDGQGKNAKWYDIEVPKLFAYNEMDHSPIFNGTETVHLTPAMRVELARGIRNSDNLRHAEGGVTFPDKELYSKGQRKEAYARGTTVKLAPETMKALFSYDNLTAEEKELFNLMDTFFDEKAKDAINETSQQIDGVDRAMSNHYSKIYTNSNYRTTDATKIDESLGGMPSLQKRVFSRNPMLAMSVWEAFDDTVDTVSKYHGLAIPVRNVDMLFNWTEQDGGNSMKNVLSQKWGGDSVKYIEELLRNLQNRQYNEKSGVDALASKALNNYVTATFGANPGIVLKQFSSFPSAAAVLGVDTIPSPAQIAKTDPKLIAKYTPELEYRSMGYATPELAELKNNPNWTQRNKTTRFLFGGAIQGMDRFTVKAMWPWAENYVKKNFTDLKPGTDAFYQKTAEVFNDAVSQTQPMYDVMHRAKIMQSPSDLTRALTMFKTVPMQQQNMLRKALGEAQNATGSEKKAANRNLARTVGSIVAANLLFEAIEFGNQLWKNAAKGYRDDDDDELTAESVGKSIVENTLKDMAGMFLGGDELTDIVDRISGKKNSYYAGLETPGISQLNNVADAIDRAGKGIRKVAEDVSDIKANGGSVKEYVEANGGDFLGDVKDLAESMSVYFAGVPVTNIEKYLLGTLRAVSPEVEQEYKAFFDTTTKRDLSGLSGEALQVRVDDLIGNRVQNVSAESKKELARLYESTGVEVIPTDVPSYVTVDGERQDLTASEQQAYRNAYSSALDGELDKMLASPEYQALPDDQKSAAITSLYSYAKDTAKRAAIGTDKEKSTEKADTAKRMGLDPAKYFALKAQIGDLDDELDGNEKSEAKLRLLRSGKLTDAEKSAAYYAISANEKEQKIIDSAPHLSVGQVTNALIDLKIARLYAGETGAKMKREALLSATLPEREKREIYREMVSDKHEEALDNLAQQGVSFDKYLQFERDSSGVTGTKDADGKDVKGQSKRDKVLGLIDGYDLTTAQKDAMYFAAGYAESTLKNAPWRSGEGAAQSMQRINPDFATFLRERGQPTQETQGLNPDFAAFLQKRQAEPRYLRKA